MISIRSNPGAAIPEHRSLKSCAIIHLGTGRGPEGLCRAGLQLRRTAACLSQVRQCHRVALNLMAGRDWERPSPTDERGGCRERTRSTGSGDR
jgi:hypothetical protein